VVVGAVGVGK
nr:Chain C, KRAS G12V (7-16) [synthetic construct]